MVIELDGVSKAYGSTKVLQNVTTRFDASSPIVCIRGESGAGKTTLLSIIGGIEFPDSGAVKINGFCAKKPKDFAFIRYIPCDGGLLDAVPVERNILFGFKNKEKHWEEKVKEVLLNLGISHTYGKYPFELSSGEYKRAQIAKMVFNFGSANAYLIDEPTANLDKESARLVRKAIKECSEKDRSKLFIIATHDSELLKMADKVTEI